jgi:hypothetical protein
MYQAYVPNAATEEMRAWVRKMSSVPGAIDIAREIADLPVAGLDLDSPEALELGQRLNNLYRQHYGDEPDAATIH